MYFDDMPVGFQFRTASRTLTAEAIKGFAQEWDPQPFHLDEEAAKASPYGGLIASGFHTILTGFKLTVEANVWSESSMGGRGGLEYLRYRRLNCRLPPKRRVFPCKFPVNRENVPETGSTKTATTTISKFHLI